MFSLLLALATVATAGNSKKKKKEEEKQGYQFTELKRLPATSVKSQDRAGTCWSWSTISFLESEMMRLGKDSVSLAPCISFGIHTTKKQINTSVCTVV